LSENTPDAEARYNPSEILKILIVDDSAADGFLFRQIAKEIGDRDVDIDIRTGYADGLSALRASVYDIGFIDYNLGGETGTDLISAAGGRSCDTPLVLLTGQFAGVVEKQGIEAGAVDFVDKNILSPQLLRRVIGYAQENHGTARELVANLESYRNIARSASQANAQKSLFLAEMSHELRTPLNAIIGFSEILKEQLLGPHEGEAATRYNGYAGDIYNSSQHLLGLIDDLLDLSKFEAGQTEAVMSETSVDELLEDLVMMTATVAGKAAVGVTVQLPVEVEDPVIDRRLILQALVNVTTNAIKFSEPGGTVHVSVEAQGAGLVLKIADNGTGIAKEDLETVMLPYRQGNAMKTRPGGGTGLGLALTSAILELHRGHLSIDSEVGAGTVVTLHLPNQVSVL